MKTLNVQYFVVLVLICANLNMGCGDKPLLVPCTNAYTFNSVTSLQNPRETYHIGDTIYLHATINHLLLDNSSQKLIDYSKHQLIMGKISLGRLDTINHLNIFNPLDYFNIIADTGQYFVNNNGLVMVTYEKFAMHTSLYLKFVPKMKGSYQLTAVDLYCNGSQEGVDDCSGAAFVNFLEVNSTRNQDILYNAQIPNAADDQHFWDRSFCFRVVE